MQVTDSQQAFAYFNQQLATIEAAVYAKQYPAKNWDKIIPVDTSGNPWADGYIYRSTDYTGEARIGANLRASDIPLVNLNRAEHSGRLVNIVTGYDYTLQDVQQASMLGLPLDADSALACREVYENAMETIVFNGHAASGFEGLLALTGVTTVAVPNGGGGTPTWATKTGDEIAADINAALIGVHSASNTVEMADTVLLADDSYNLLATKRLGDTEQTVLEWLRTNNVYTASSGKPLTIRAVRQLRTAGAGGTRRMLVYRNDPDVVRIKLPLPLQFFPTQNELFVFRRPALARTGGVNLRRPGAFRYSDGM